MDHLCGAPIVLNLLANAPAELKQGIEHQVKVMTAASAPPPAVLQAMEEMHFPVTPRIRSDRGIRAGGRVCLA